MKLTTLVENTACREDLGAEHGLSLYLETGSRKLLFDCGQTDLFRDNAKKLGVDLSQVDTLVLSHGHYDHGGGLYAFMEENKTAKIYASDLCFGDFYHGPDKFIGLNPTLRTCPRILPVEDPMSLGNGLQLIPGRMVVANHKIDAGGLTFRAGHLWIPDTFLHEQYLLLEENGKKILFSGCSHRGIVNIAEHFQPDILIGGFHFKNLDPEKDQEKLKESALALQKLPTRYYTCHCTGTAQYEYLKTILGDRLSYLATGSQLEV